MLEVFKGYRFYTGSSTAELASKLRWEESGVVAGFGVLRFEKIIFAFQV